MLKKRLTILGLVLLLGICSLCASSSTDVDGAMQWSLTYGGSGWEEAEAMVQTIDGGFILAGSTSSYGAGDLDFWLVKTNDKGWDRWNQTYGGSENDKAYSVIQTSDEGFALAGYTRSFGAGDLDFWLVKTDDRGNKEWSQTYGGFDTDRAYSVIQTSDGGFALTGYTESHGAGNRNIWLVKTDALGNEQWNQIYGGGTAYSVIQTNDNGLILAGQKAEETGAWNRAWLVKTDAQGNEQWSQTYTTAELSWFTAVIPTIDDGFASLGRTFTMGAPAAIGWMIKLDSEGTEQWRYNEFPTYGPFISYNNIIQTFDEGFAIIGTTDCADYCDEVDTDGWLMKLDAIGHREWDRIYGGSEMDDAATALVQTEDRGIVFAGYTSSCGAGVSDFWLVKTIPIPTQLTITTTETATVTIPDLTTVTSTAQNTVTITTTVTIASEVEVYSLLLVLPITLFWLQRRLRSR